MATINLGSIKFNWKGSYSGATAYVVDDVVESSGSSYICIAATTGNAPPNATYWQQMSAKGTDGTNGTNGTDLTTTLTTQGDLVYRDGSGLQRLGAGTNGQVLTTGGAGANPSWGTVSSDYVKLASFSDTTSAPTFQIDGYFNSTYKSYKIIFTGTSGGSAQDFYVRVNTSTGTADASSNYVYAGAGWYRTSSSSNANSISGWNQNKWHIGYGGGDFSYATFGEITLHNPLNAEYKTINYNIGMYNTGSDFYTNAGSASWQSGTALTGLTFFYSVVNISFKKFNLYGLK